MYQYRIVKRTRPSLVTFYVEMRVPGILEEWRRVSGGTYYSFGEAKARVEGLMRPSVDKSEVVWESGETEGRKPTNVIG